MEIDEQDRRVLVVDDEPDMRTMLGRVIGKKLGCAVQLAGSAGEALEIAASWKPAVVLTDIKMPQMDGLEFQRRLGLDDPTVSIIIMTGYGTIELAVQAIKEGAYDFFEKPFENEQILHAIGRAMERTRLMRENQRLHRQLIDNQDKSGLIGESKRIRQTLDLLSRLAGSTATVLIRGASGTGKELAARALHAMSPRCHKRMVTVNCPALPEHILESELFGYRRGAFTGADRDKDGLFVEAEGSTILLDEIADIPVPLQTKLLRVLQEKEIQPLGQTRTIPVDVRVLASTNQDLEQKMEQGEFREDLFYRLNVMTVTMPTLAEIDSDIPLLAQHFLEKYSREHGRTGLSFSPEALRCMMQRPWRGNIRELQNAVNRAVLLCQSNLITPFDLVQETNSAKPDEAATVSEQACYLQLPYKQAKEEVLSSFTRTYLSGLLNRTGGNISAAARQCGVERQALQRLLRRYGLSPMPFRE